MHHCEHEQKNCQHKNVKYCPHCQKIYCEDCKKEWAESCQLNHYPYYHWVYPYRWDTTYTQPTYDMTKITGNDINCTSDTSEFVCGHTLTN